MKIAITSTGNHPLCEIDSRFGRCAYIVVYDTELKSTEYIPNPNKGNIESAGVDTLKMISMRGVTRIVSGEFGIKVKTMADSLKIQLIILSDNGKKIQEIINFFDH